MDFFFVYLGLELLNLNSEQMKIESNNPPSRIVDDIKRLVGKQFKHRNGNIYTVLLLTNTDSTPERLVDHPIDVVYMGQNGKIWSRRLSDWDRSFTNVL
jgi:hypothetical protein